MIILDESNNKLRVHVYGNAAAPTIDVQAFWMDRTTSGVITPGRTNLTISSITGDTGTVAADAPGASTYRTVKLLSIRNRSANNHNQIKVSVYDPTATTYMQLMNVLLRPGATLLYDEHHGFRTYSPVLGSVYAKRLTQDNNMAIGDAVAVVLAADVAAYHSVANTAFDVSQLSFSPSPSRTYYFRFFLQYTSTATGTGSRFVVYSHPSMLLASAAIRYREEASLTTTSKTSTEGHAAFSLPAASNATSAATGANIAVIEGFYTSPTDDFNTYPAAENDFVGLQIASETASGTGNITLMTGSTLFYQRVL